MKDHGGSGRAYFPVRLPAIKQNDAAKDLALGPVSRDVRLPPRISLVRRITAVNKGARWYSVPVAAPAGLLLEPSPCHPVLVDLVPVNAKVELVQVGADLVACYGYGLDES